MTSDIYTSFKRDLLLPETAGLRSDGKSVLLLLDNFGAHHKSAACWRLLQRTVDTCWRSLRTARTSYSRSMWKSCSP